VYKEVSPGPYDYVRSPETSDAINRPDGEGRVGRSSGSRSSAGLSPLSIGRGASRSRSRDGRSAGITGEKEAWHWHTKQRHLMKAEMEDAFKVRKWVVMFLIVGACGTAFGVFVVGKWAMYFLEEFLGARWMNDVVRRERCIEKRWWGCSSPEL